MNKQDKKEIIGMGAILAILITSYFTGMIVVVFPLLIVLPFAFFL